jgi:capsule biosynthesis phosphatase
MTLKKLVFDLDGTLTIDEPHIKYIDKRPNVPMIEKLKKYKEDGFEIVIFTARNMRTFNGSIGKINAYTLPEIIHWLNVNNVPFDEIYIGKPWCGTEGFYIDDKAIRPTEFLKLNYNEILDLINSKSSYVQS